MPNLLEEAGRVSAGLASCEEVAQPLSTSIKLEDESDTLFLTDSEEIEPKHIRTQETVREEAKVLSNNEFETTTINTSVNLPNTDKVNREAGNTTSPTGLAQSVLPLLSTNNAVQLAGNIPTGPRGFKILSRSTSQDNQAAKNVLSTAAEARGSLPTKDLRLEQGQTLRNTQHLLSTVTKPSQVRPPAVEPAVILPIPRKTTVQSKTRSESEPLGCWFWRFGLAGCYKTATECKMLHAYTPWVASRTSHGEPMYHGLPKTPDDYSEAESRHEMVDDSSDTPIVDRLWGNFPITSENKNRISGTILANIKHRGEPNVTIQPS